MMQQYNKLEVENIGQEIKNRRQDVLASMLMYYTKYFLRARSFLKLVVMQFKTHAPFSVSFILHSKKFILSNPK